VRSEDTLILNILTPGETNVIPVYNALELFLHLKKSTDESNRFNIIFFLEDGPNYLESFTLNPEHILFAIKSLNKEMVRGNVGGGLFVAISFIIDVFKKIPEKTFRLIILTDSGSPKIANIYIPIIKNLLDQVKDMPLFLDIIRINTNDPDEDVKLLDLARRCRGEIHKVFDIGELGPVLETLSSNRELAANLSNNGEYYIIPEENHLFYINLADDLEEINEVDTCSICFQKNEDPVIKCPNCGIVSHKICGAQWAISATSSNIGILHVFRCHNCYNLIKLDKSFVESIKLAKVVQTANILKDNSLSNIREYLESLEIEDGPKIMYINDPLGIPKEKIIADGLNEVEESENEELELEEVDEVKFMLCPKCLKMITNQYKRCPNCHKMID